MLEWMQKHKKYLVVTVWVSALALIFAGLVEWGGGGFSVGSKDIVAKVGNLEVSRSEYQRAYDFYGITDDEEAKMLGVDNEAFRETVRAKLLELISKEIGITTTKEEMLDFLLHIPAFQVNNRFDKSQYSTFLAKTGQKAESFEKLVAKEILNAKIQNFPLFSPATLEFNTFLTANNIADDISVAVLHKKELLKNEHFDISDSRIQEFWNTNKDNYYKPAVYNIAYIAIDSNLIPLHTESLEQFFNDNKTKYSADALETQDKNLLHDYRLEQARLYAQLALSFIETHLKDSYKPQNVMKLTKNADFKMLSLESLKKVQDSILDGEAMPKDMIPIEYAAISEKNTEIYPQLLINLNSMSSHIPTDGKVSDIAQQRLDLIENDNIIIAPYFIAKSQRVPLEFSEVKEKVTHDLLTHDEQTRFKEIAQHKLKYIMQHGNDDKMMQHIGFVTLADSTLRNSNAIVPARNDIHIHSLQDSEIKYFISQIFQENSKYGLVFLDNNRILLYIINQQRLLNLNELLNASNNALDEIAQSKTRDMRNALFEYATAKYRVIDYRRKD
ncbi:hypothetical protein CQA66_05290 [Helicobacter aurati]|uniref:Peptidylprolyl isomerase n=1 Tax=Helicobacter aurati TaxID=137778 RepID=A0A3D8J4D0_9HELI|nr:SurA N-terminal domain-containing protein [Helicobacter aurati]RDU72293.1 hypothetical protein CQA66_05290 [Helicobacter aurati]